MTRRRVDVAAFLRRMGAVPEAAMRQALWRECLREAEGESLLAAVDAVLAGLSEVRSDAVDLAYHALVQVIEADPPAATDRLRGLAQVTGRAAVLALFVDAPAAQIAEPTELRAPPLDPDREVTLGERRWKARSSDRGILERLLLDQDPVVIDHLLQNPRVVEQDVLKIASRRPNGAEVLRRLFRHPRWGRRRAVQWALVLNPYTPVDVGRALVGLLDREHLRRLAAEPSVHDEVRGLAALRLGAGG
jgi:hypothetical protein